MTIDLRVFVAVERAPDWRLELWTRDSSRGRLLGQGALPKMLAQCAVRATGSNDSVHVLASTSPDWYPPTGAYGWAGVSPREVRQCS